MIGSPADQTLRGHYLADERLGWKRAGRTSKKKTHGTLSHTARALRMGSHLYSPSMSCGCAEAVQACSLSNRLKNLNATNHVGALVDEIPQGPCESRNQLKKLAGKLRINTQRRMQSTGKIF